MSLVLEYKMKKGCKPTKENIKTCDTARKAMQDLLVTTAEITAPKSKWSIWLLTRFYKKRVTDESISYEFYLIKDYVK